ncbi:MAG: 2-amino-4-hydroxy-6-hydroxymethyldihydropteridine diphosphokinase, partial [Aquaticitalea sp.]
MRPPQKVYIALGSNKGDRLKHLQDAIDLIFKRIGTTQAISKVYNSEAVGFEGNDFLNCCTSVE